MGQRESQYPISVDEALRRGHLTVTYPSMAVFGFALVLLYLFPDAPDLVWLPVLVVTFCGAWLWWSWRLPHWRVWVLENVEDADAAFAQAVSEKLMWPPGHFFERTEIRTEAITQRERAAWLRRESIERSSVD